MRFMTWIVVYALVIGANVSTAQVPATSLVAGELVQYELARPLDDLPEESRGTFQTLTPSVVMLSEVEDFSVPGPVELPRELIADFEVARGTKDIRWPGAVVVGAAGCLAGYAMAERSSAEDGELLGHLPRLSHRVTRRWDPRLFRGQPDHRPPVGRCGSQLTRRIPFA